MNSQSVEVFSLICFVLALLHTFSVKKFAQIGNHFANGSVGENFFHLMSEVEVVFGLWAAILLCGMCFLQSPTDALNYVETRNYTEPAFVFVIMVIASTKPVVYAAMRLIEGIAKLLPFQASLSFYMVLMFLGPLLGSFITEPAAMTVTALILYERFFTKGFSTPMKYATLGLLFVSVSIGGTLTSYAAPPVLMVATTWGWDSLYMFLNFGDKAILAIAVSTTWVVLRNRKEFIELQWSSENLQAARIPFWVILLHLMFLLIVVLSAHHPVLFLGAFLFFVGLAAVTKEYQSELKIKEALLVGFFLAGLVVLGGLQRWWLEPILLQLESGVLFLGATGLTAITDNAALTYLGSLVPNLSDASKYALVSGAVVGGGLTVIANAPNPAGYGILNPAFGHSGISPWRLFTSALLPTVIAGLCFWFL